MIRSSITDFAKLYELLKAKNIKGVGEMINSQPDDDGGKRAKAHWKRLNDTDKEFILCDLIIGFPFETLDKLSTIEDEILLEWAIKRQAEITLEKVRLERKIAKGNKQWKN